MQVPHLHTYLGRQVRTLFRREPMANQPTYSQSTTNKRPSVEQDTFSPAPEPNLAGGRCHSQDTFRQLLNPTYPVVAVTPKTLFACS